MQLDLSHDEIRHAHTREERKNFNSWITKTIVYTFEIFVCMRATKKRSKQRNTKKKKKNMDQNCYTAKLIFWFLLEFWKN